AARRGFGIVIAADAEGPRGSHVPFAIRQSEGRLVAQFHLTARNPLIGLADGQTRFLLVVPGADAYVSNDWYDSPDQVSTWLYEAVHLSGIGRLRPLGENRPHGDELLAVSEARLPKRPWSMAGMDPGKHDSILALFMMIDIEFDRIEGQSKLNPHNIDADHFAVARQLARSEDSAVRQLAARMRALRPSLDYGTD